VRVHAVRVDADVPRREPWAAIQGIERPAVDRIVDAVVIPRQIPPFVIDFDCIVAGIAKWMPMLSVMDPVMWLA